MTGWCGIVNQIAYAPIKSDSPTVSMLPLKPSVVSNPTFVPIMVDDNLLVGKSAGFWGWNVHDH